MSFECEKYVNKVSKQGKYILCFRRNSPMRYLSGSNPINKLMTIWAFFY
jgi:hypothetical protein